MKFILYPWKIQLLVLVGWINRHQQNAALAEICSIVTPETILRWHKNLVAQKWDYSKCRKKVGRPKTDKEIVKLPAQTTNENPNMGP